MEKNSFKGIFAALFMSIIIGLQFYFIKELTEIFSDGLLSFIALRFLIAFIPIMFFIGKATPKKAFRKEMVLLSLISPFVNIMVQTYGVKLSEVTSVGYISSLGPVITLIMGSVVLKTKITKRQIFSLFVVGLGTVLIELKNQGETSFFNIGALLIFSALFTRSLYAVLSKKESENYTPFELSFAQIMWGFIYFSVSAVIFELDFISSELIPILTKLNFFDILSLFYVSVCSITIVYWLNNYSLSKISIQLSGIMSNLTFVVTLLSGVFLSGESISLVSGIGAGLIIIGVCLIKSQ